MAVDRELGQTFFECRSQVVAGSYEQLIESAFPGGVLSAAGEGKSCHDCCGSADGCWLDCSDRRQPVVAARNDVTLLLYKLI